jgi:hypothetical protein
MLPDLEIQRLLDVMPASGRMITQIRSKPEQRVVIDSPFPTPWMQNRPIWINFDLWDRLSLQERDLLILRTVSWVMGVQWFRPRLEQGLALAGLLGTGVELVQTDPVGILAAAGLTAIALRQVWRNNRSTERELDADTNALRVAQRRGYSETAAARHLLSAIEAVADLEKRASLNFMELLRCQNLRAIAGISPIGMPESLKHNP